MKKIYKRILSLGLAVGVIFSLQESVHICAQENSQTTESIFEDYGVENGADTRGDGNREKYGADNSDWHPLHHGCG